MSLQSRNESLVEHVENLPVTLYTPESQLRNPSLLLRSMGQDLKASRELAWRLFIRDVSATYRQSLLGVFWAFVPPVITGLIFIILQSRKVVDLGETDIPYPVFVLVGTILWQLFTESLNAPLKSVTQAKPMLAKINFPREALVVSAFYTMLLSFLIKSVVLAGIFIYFQIPFTRGLILAPVAVLALILLGISIGLLLTPIGTFYTDIATSLPVVSQLWFFVTPVVYPPPSNFPFSLIATLNPVSPLLIAARDLATKGILTNSEQFFITSGLMGLTLLAAWIVYRTALPIMIERMQA